MKTKSRLAHVLMITFMLGLTAPTYANDIVVNFIAVIDSIEDWYNYIGDDDLKKGDTLRGYYTYDPSVLDSDPSPHKGVYHHTTTPYGIVVYSEYLVFETDPNNVNFYIMIHDSFTSGPFLYDAYDVMSYGNREQFSLDVDLIQVDLWDVTATALSSDALPTSAPDLNDWPYKALSIYGGGFIYHIRAPFISMSIAGIPTLSRWNVLICVVVLLLIGACLIYASKKRASGRGT